MNISAERKAVAIYLNPGEIAVAEGPATITTVLGSCVAVTFFSPRKNIGAICHAVLPHGSDKEPGKFVNQAIAYMLNFFGKHQISEKELVAKVFGGSDMFPQTRGSCDSATIGAQNIKATLVILEKSGISPTVVEVGGQHGRKVVFFSDTGDVYVKKVKKEQLQTAAEILAEREKSNKPMRQITPTAG